MQNCKPVRNKDQIIFWITTNLLIVYTFSVIPLNIVPGTINQLIGLSLTLMAGSALPPHRKAPLRLCAHKYHNTAGKRDQKGFCASSQKISLPANVNKDDVVIDLRYFIKRSPKQNSIKIPGAVLKTFFFCWLLRELLTGLDQILTCKIHAATNTIKRKRTASLHRQIQSILLPNNKLMTLLTIKDKQFVTCYRVSLCSHLLKTKND